MVDELLPRGGSQRFQSLAEYVLASSEAYQLLFSAPPAATPALEQAAAGGLPGVTLTRLGMVVDAAEGCRYRDELGGDHPLQPIGFHHLTEE